MKTLFSFLIVCGMIGCCMSLQAQWAIPHSVLAGGGEPIANSSYRINSTVGQMLIGRISETANVKQVGFWYAAGSIKVGIDRTPSAKDFFLLGNYPNPFAQFTAIRYRLFSFRHVTLEIFDVLGRNIATLVDAEQEAGEHEAIFDASYLAHARGSQLFYCVLKTKDGSRSHPLIKLD